jgi:hypothetical protein
MTPRLRLDRPHDDSEPIWLHKRVRESFAVLVEYGAQPLAIKAKAKSGFFANWSIFCFAFFQV